MRPNLSFANVVSVLALFIALGGSAYAFHLGKNSVGSKQLKKSAVGTAKIKNEAITAGKVKKGALTGTQINAATLGTVPTAQTANNLTAPEAWHEVGAPGEPGFQDGWHNLPSVSSRETVGFYKDQLGVVHLKGAATSAAAGAVFVLPNGYRPARGRLLQFAVPCICAEGGTGTAVIQGPGLGDDGAVVSPGTFISISGITFRAES